MKWYDYEIVSPKEDGNYLIYISENIHVGSFSKGFGFFSIEDNCAFVQDQITHWSVLPDPHNKLDRLNWRFLLPKVPQLIKIIH